MSHFEFIMVMASIISGLGLTLALRGISRLARSPKNEPAVLMWAVFLVMLYLQNWWAFWDMSAVEDWNFLKFLFVSAFVCVVYAMTELMVPMSSSTETDWPAHFSSIRKWFFVMVMVLVILGVTMNVYISGIPLLHPYRIMQAAIFILAVIGWIMPGLLVHRWIVVLMLVVLIAGQVLFRLMPGLSS